MINLENLQRHDIYPIPLSDYLSDESDKYVFYSPLSHELVVKSAAEANSIISEFNKSGQISEPIIKSWISERDLPEINYVNTPKEVYALTILPNNICNFSCNYCYAAKGHGRDQIDDETLKAVLDFFVDSKRIKREHLYISFGGGGEPLLSWAKIKLILEYSEFLAKKHGKTIHYSFASNGSVISDEIIEYIKRYDIKVNISFDILEDMQNIQRGHYTRVCQTLDILLEADITPTINSVITPTNVNLQEDMVREVIRRFPKLKRLSFDYVVDGELYDTVSELEKFYDKYITNFFRARQLGKDFSIEVSSIKYHNLEQLKSRACAGGFDLTPLGEISVCFFISSPKEKLYKDFIYGKVSGGEVTFDEKKFADMVNSSANSQDKCKNCFLKWHCAGGCLFHARSYTPEKLDAMCRFQRKFSIVALLNNVTGLNILENEDALS